ncbi:MAG: hypothetical protein NT034_03515 [Candidatus Magasanikbacteria bacterium]|nr:hypothetical protein [Candidatus Magasanikbacteria bacterium]
MNNLLKLGKKIFTVGVASTTIFWSLGVAALVPAVATAATQVDCATVVAGDFVKANGADIWVVNADKSKSYFPHGDTFKSWTSDSKYTFKYVTGDCLASFPAASLVAPRPGAYLLKDNATDKLYVTLADGKLAEISASAAAGLYGANYAATPAKGGRTIPATSPDMVLYTKSMSTVKVTEAAPVEGTLVSNGGKFYVVAANKTLREVTATGMTANKFQSKFSVVLASTSGYSMGTSVTAMESALTDVTFGFKAAPGTVVVPPAAAVSVSLNAGTPAATTIPQKATGVEYLKFNVSGSGTLNDMIFHRVGVGSASDFSNVYVYDGNTRLTSGRSVSSDSNQVIFSNLKVALSGSKTLRLVADLNTATSGEDGFEVTQANGSAVSGVVGNIMHIGGSAVSKVTIDNSGTSGTLRLGQSQAEVARGTINAGSATYDVKVSQLVLTNGGTVSNSNLANLKLTIGSTDVATAASMTGDKVIFNLATPYTITKGNTKTFVVYADSTGGRVNDTIAFYVDQTSDAVILDSQYNVGVSFTNATANDLFLFASGNQTYTLTGGDLTLANNGPAAQNIGKNVTNVTLQKFSFSAANNVTVKTTRVWVYMQDAAGNAVPTTTVLDLVKNVKIVDLDANNQTVVGPQSAFGTGTTASAPGFYKDFTDTYDINAGATRNFAVVADMDTSLTSGFKLYSKVDYSQSNDVKYVDNSQYVAASTIVPNTLTGNTMTISGAQLTVSRTTPPASASVVKGSTQNGLGLLLTAGTSADLKVTSLKLRVFASTTAITSDNGNTAANEVVNTVALYEDGAPTPLMTKNLSDLSGTIGSGGYYYVTFNNLNYKLAAGASKKLVAVLGLKDSISATRYVSVDLQATDDIDVETFADGQSVTENTNTTINATSPVYLTVTTGGTVTVAVDGNTPSASDILSGSTAAVPVATYKLTPTQESFTLTGAVLKATTGYYTDVAKVVLTYKNKAGVTVSKDCYLDNSDECTFNDGQLDAYLVKDQPNLITVSAYFNKIADGATSGHAIKIGFKKASAQFSTSANLTNGFILLGEGSNNKKYGVTDSIALVDSGINAQTLHKTEVTVAESDSSGTAHTTKSQDAVGVFTFTSAAEAGSNQNSTLNTVTVQLTGNLIASSVGNNTLTVNVYDSASFDASHLMGTGTLTGLDTGSSTALDILLTAHNEWSGSKQVYFVVDTTDADFSDTNSNAEKLTTTLSSFTWNDGTGLLTASYGLPVYGDTYSY